MRITVDVTQADIDAGERCDCERCAVALAIRRALPDGWVGVEVGSVTARIRRANGDYYVSKLPHKAFVLIRELDALRPVEPITFELEIPE